MSQNTTAIEQAKALIESQLTQACADALELKSTGVLPQGPMRQAIELLNMHGMPSGSMMLAQSLIHTAAMESVLARHKNISLQVLPY